VTASRTARLPGRRLTAPRLTALIMAQLFFFPFIALPLIIWLFPDGRPPPGRWRFVFWACPVLLVPALVSILVLTGAALASPHLRTLADGELPRVENTPPLASILSLIFFASLLISWLCALAYQIASWRRSTGERRQQLKWLMSGAAICGLSAAASFASTAGAAVAAFAARTSGAGALDELRADLLGVIGHALEPAHQSLRLSKDGP
jgi:MFS family permease